MRDNLLVVRTGRNSLVGDWIEEDDARSWDIVTVPYESPDVAPLATIALADSSSHIVQGNKFDGLAWWVDNNRDTWAAYRYICLPDDDLRVPPGTWSKFFAMCREIDVDLAACALTPDSIHSHPVTVQVPQYRYRQTTFVEVMMPCFHVDLFARIRNTWHLSKSGLGWGLDYVWPKLLDYEGIYVMDAMPISHWRPTTTARSAFAQAEMHDMMVKYGISNPPERTLRGFT